MLMSSEVLFITLFIKKLEVRGLPVIWLCVFRCRLLNLLRLTEYLLVLEDKATAEEQVNRSMSEPREVKYRDFVSCYRGKMKQFLYEYKIQEHFPGSDIF